MHRIHIPPVKVMINYANERASAKDEKKSQRIVGGEEMNGIMCQGL